MSIFNFYFASPNLFILSLSSSFFILLFRKCLISKPIYSVIYYFILFIIYIVLTVIGGGGVINNAYSRLETFKEIEARGELEEARKNPNKYIEARSKLEEKSHHNYNYMLVIDLGQFANSKEFKNYIHDIYEEDTDKNEAIGIGVLFAIIAELSNMIAFYSRRFKK